MAADVVALLDTIAADEPVDLVGHSLGGLVACLVAVHRGEPGQVLAVVTVFLDA